MSYKSALEILLDNIGPREARLGLSKSTPDITRENYVAHIRDYEKSVKIVTGEANNQLFERADLLQALREGLSHRSWKTLQLVFHKNDDVEIAREEFRVRNKELVDLKFEFPDQVHVYWSPIRPRQHYAVIDEGKKAILEEPNHVGGQPFWATVVFDENRAENWAKRFNEFVKYCTELVFEPPNQSTA